MEIKDTLQQQKKKGRNYLILILRSYLHFKLVDYGNVRFKNQLDNLKFLAHCDS